MNFLDFHALREHQGILDINAEIANRCFDLGMPKQDLDSAQIARLLINEGCLGPAQRMRAVVLRAQADRHHPLIHEPRILPRAEMPGWIAAARKNKIIKRPAPPFELGEEARACRFHDLKLNRLVGLLLDDDGTRLHRATADNIAGLQFHQIATTQTAVDGDIEQSAIPEPLFMVEIKSDRPDLLHLEGAFRAHKVTGILGSAFVISGVKAGSSHDALHPGAPPGAIERSECDRPVSRDARIESAWENVSFRDLPCAV